MLRLTALAAIVAGASANNVPVYPKANHHLKKTTPGLPLASLGVFFDKKCRQFPDLVVETPPGACTPFPATSVYFQILCGDAVPAVPVKVPKKKVVQDSSSGKGRRLADDSSSSSSSSSTTATDSSSSTKDDSSSSSSFTPTKKHKAHRAKVTRVPVALRLCRDKFCKHCKKVLVTKTNKCTALPTHTYYGRALNNVPQWQPPAPSNKIGFCAFEAKCPAPVAVPAHA